MKTVRVRDNQTWFDIALQETGSLENMFGLMMATDNASLQPTSGILINVPDYLRDKDYVANYYLNNNIIPATGLGGATAAGDGIGYWIIGDDFIVQ